MNADMLHPTASTWQRAIDLGPVEPRIRDLVIDGYRELLTVARFLGKTDEIAHCLSRLEELTGGAN
jgi:hypothetical protein